jgi:serine phosphatase RsbU (regulator of sigma subunit)
VDTATDPRTTDQYAAFWLEARVRSIVLVPLLREGKWTALFSAIASQSRQWLPEEVRLLEAVAERMWPSMENARMHVEARIRAEREALLSECSRLFNASLDYAETLASVAQMIVPRFSDWCAVDLLGSDGQPARVAVAHVNPEKVAWAWELHRQNPTRREAERGVAAVLRSGKSEFMPRIPDQMLVAAARDSDQLRLLREIGLRSVLIVPLAVRGNVLGALTLVATDESGRFFSDEDLRFAEEIGRRAALAIENARLFQATQEAEAKQRRIADTLQESMLLALPAPDAFQGLEISPYYEAAWDEALIGGDYGDAFQLDNNRVALVVGDCTGKGLAAARFLAECQFMLRAFLRETGEPDDSLLRLNRMLIESQRLDRRPESALTTVAVAVIDLQTGETVLSVGGAEPPLLIAAATGKGTAIEVRGPLVGMDASARYERAILTLHPGDILLLTSDGTTEARSRTTRQFFGYDGLTRAAEELALGRPELTGLAKDIVDRAREFAGGALTDDACVVVARYIGR